MAREPDPGYPWLLGAIQQVLGTDGNGNGNGQTVAFDRIVTEWWSELEDEYGPDSEAPSEVWQALSYAHERLRQMSGLDRASPKRGRRRA